MPGVPGSGGPPPKRDAQRRRRNAPTVPTVTASSDGTVRGYDLEGDHSPLAFRFWVALRQSGQTQFFEPSDWFTAELVVAAIDQFVATPSAALLASIQSLMTSLLVTEGDRRRLRVELERTAPEATPDAAVTALDDFRRRVAGA